jgi:hypothetical protein
LTPSATEYTPLVSQTFPDALRHRKNHLPVIVDGQSFPFLDHSLLDRLSGGRARSAAVDSYAEIILYKAARVKE